MSYIYIYPVKCKVERTLLYLKKFKPLSNTIYISEKNYIPPPPPNSTLNIITISKL